MKQMVKEALEKKVVWPWITTKDEDSDQRKTMLKSSGFKEWKKSKAGKKNDWNMRFGIDPKTGKFLNYGFGELSTNKKIQLRELSLFETLICIEAYSEHQLFHV